MRRTRAVGVVVALLGATTLVAGCSGSPGSSQGPDDPGVDDLAILPMASALPWAQVASTPPSGTLTLVDPGAPAPVMIDLTTTTDAVEGTDYEVLTDTAPASSQWSLMELALRPDGRMFTVKTPTDQYDGGAWLLKPQTVGMLEGDTFTAWTSSESVFRDDHPRQAYQASTDGSSTAWVETTSTQMGISNWRIFVDDGGTPRLLAASEDVFAGDLPVQGDSTGVLVSDGRVYWNTAVPLDSSGRSFGAQVMSRAYDGSDTARVEAAGARQPAVATDGLYVARSHMEDPATPDGIIEIARATGDGRSEPILTYAGAPGSNVNSLVAEANRLAFVVGPGDDTNGHVVFLDLTTRQITQVPLLGPGRAATVAICGDRLLWTSANGSTDVPDSASIGILDLTTLAVSRIVDQDNYGEVHCAGDLFYWRTLKLTPDARAMPTLAHWLTD